LTIHAFRFFDALPLVWQITRQFKTNKDS
jgi:hypothetical protein